MQLRALLLVTAAIALAAPLLGGCSSTGEKKAEAVDHGVVAKINAEQGAPAARFDPQAKESYGNYLNARLAASQHEMADAARFYRASLKGDPSNPDLLARAFLYSASAGEVEGAAKLAADVVIHEPQNRAARTTLAVVAFKQGKFAEARNQLAQSASGPFTALTLTLLKGWARMGERDLAQALEELKALNAQGGTNTLESFHRALMLESAGRDAEAGSAYREAMVSGGNGPRIVEAYGRYLERTGKRDEAKALYDGLASDGALAPVVMSARARMEAGRKPERMVATAEDGAAEALFGIAASLTDDASADVSVLYLRFTLYLRGELHLAQLLLADRMERLEKYDQAIAIYHGIPKDSPYRRIALVQAAINEARLERNDKAIIDLKEVVASHPDDAEAWTALGDVYRGTERYVEASDAYDHAIRIRGSHEASNWPLLYARAVSFEQSNRWEQAEADLKAALKLNPQEPQLLNYLGYSWVDKGVNLEEALEMLEKARAMRPFDGYIADSVGWAYYRLGRYHEAAAALQSAVLLVPGDPTINDHLGDALWKIGRKLDARFQWNHALSFGASEAEKVKIEAKLKHGLPVAPKS